MLRAAGLSKTYAGPHGVPVPVLHGIELEVKSGEFVAVVGASGSGKSTLLNLLGLLEPASAGEVWLGEERVSHLGRRAQARVRGASIGYVFQSFLLLSGLTALDNVLLAARYVGRTTTRPSSRAGSSSASPTAGPCSIGRRSCWQTSRPAISTTSTRE